MTIKNLQELINLDDLENKISNCMRIYIGSSIRQRRKALKLTQREALKNDYAGENMQDYAGELSYIENYKIDQKRNPNIIRPAMLSDLTRNLGYGSVFDLVFDTPSGCLNLLALFYSSVIDLGAKMERFGSLYSEKAVSQTSLDASNSFNELRKLIEILDPKQAIGNAIIDTGLDKKSNELLRIINERPDMFRIVFSTYACEVRQQNYMFTAGVPITKPRLEGTLNFINIFFRLFCFMIKREFKDISDMKDLSFNIALFMRDTFLPKIVEDVDKMHTEIPMATGRAIYNGLIEIGGDIIKNERSTSFRQVERIESLIQSEWHNILTQWDDYANEYTQNSKNALRIKVDANILNEVELDNFLKNKIPGNKNNKRRLEDIIDW